MDAILPTPQAKNSRRQFLWQLGLGATVLAGCRRSASTSRRGDEEEMELPPLSLRLLVVDDPLLAESIRRQWELRGEGELEVLTVTASELLSDARGPVTDGVIFPSGMLGEMIQRNWLLPISDDLLQDADLDWRDLFDSLRLREATWSRTVYGIPLGSPVFLLWYRVDEWKKRELELPKTWTEYLQAITQLRASLPDNSDVAAAAEPLAEGWGSQLLMARAAGYSQSRSFLASWFDGTTMKPLVDSPPFVRALEEMAHTSGGLAALELTPSDAWDQFLQGRALSAITWPTSRSRLADSRTSAESGEVASPSESLGAIEVSELPGAADGYDRVRGIWSPRENDEGEARVTLLGSAGRLAAVTRRTTNQRGTATLLGWLAGREWSDQVASASPFTTLYRGEHLARPGNWLPEELADRVGPAYGDVVQQALTRSAGVHSIRIPGRHRYLAALDTAVAATIRGEQTAEQALRHAATQWQAITDELGIEAQRKAYRESLNLQ